MDSTIQILKAATEVLEYLDHKYHRDTAVYGKESTSVYPKNLIDSIRLVEATAICNPPLVWYEATRQNLCVAGISRILHKYPDAKRVMWEFKGADGKSAKDLQREDAMKDILKS